MLALLLICQYCGKDWQVSVYSMASIQGERCPTCKDQNIRVRDLSKSDIDYYQGAPAFSEKETKSDNYPWDGSGGD
jgi:hypothetical protein